MKRIIMLLVLVTAPLLQAAEIVGKHGVEILAVDGKKIKQTLFNKAELDFSEGEHQIVVMYKRTFHNSDSVTSKPHIFNISVAGKTEVSVKSYNNRFRAQKAVDDGLQWIITNSKGTTLINDSVAISREGLFPTSDIEGLIADYNKSNEVETSQPTKAETSTQSSTVSIVEASTPTMTKPAASVTAVAPATTAASVPSTKNISNTDILIHTYMKANKQEQKAFRMWLLEQDMK